MSNSLKTHCDNFFREAENYEDINFDKHSKDALLESVNDFIENGPTTDKAIAVYETFSRAYWMIEDDDSIIKMINEMRRCEETAGILTSRQRDHFMHSVFVFLLGLAIYSNSPLLQTYFTESVQHKGQYKDFYKTRHEEFLYRWGIASLFHDIGYPIEIAHSQLKSYLSFVSNNCGMVDCLLDVSLQIKNSDAFNLLPKLNPSNKYVDEFIEKYPTFGNIATNALSLVAEQMGQSFNIEFDKLDTELFSYVDHMSDQNFIDHGYYSALIMLRWFHKLINEKNWNPVYFYFSIVNSASAIILHNYYSKGLMKSPFNLPTLDASQHPLAFLLILCDEMQDWARPAYGSNYTSTLTIFPDDIELIFDNDSLAFNYICKNQSFDACKFINDKIEKIKRVLNTDTVFKNISAC